MRFINSFYVNKFNRMWPDDIIHGGVEACNGQYINARVLMLRLREEADAGSKVYLKNRSTL